MEEIKQGSSPDIFPTRGSGQEVFGISRIGLDGAGSGQEDFTSSRIGSGHRDPTRPDPTRPDLTREV